MGDGQPNLSFKSGLPWPTNQRVAPALAAPLTPPRRGARRPMRLRERRASTVRTLFEQERK
nr:MAG TPA: hypothetical protein [Caudoviricetes sp.]